MSTTELRTDPFTGQRVVIAGDRANRPGGEFEVPRPPQVVPDDDPFLEGHEHRTPPELDADRPGGSAPDGPGWLTRTIPNEYPIVRPDAPAPQAEAQTDLFRAVAARGGHEVIVQAPGPVSNLVELGPAGVATAVTAWQRRLRAHANAPARHLICNEGEEAGASQPHTHAQLMTLPLVPASMAAERERAQAYANQTQGSSLAGDYLQEEVRRRERIVAIDDECVLLAPYASRGAFHLIVHPRTPRLRLEDEPDGTGGAMLHDALRRLAARFGAPPPVNIWVRTAVAGAERTSWRIELYPALDPPGGIELGAGIDACTVAPEQAAAELRAL